MSPPAMLGACHAGRYSSRCYSHPHRCHGDRGASSGPCLVLLEGSTQPRCWAHSSSSGLPRGIWKVPGHLQSQPAARHHLQREGVAVSFRRAGVLCWTPRLFPPPKSPGAPRAAPCLASRRGRRQWLSRRLFWEGCLVPWECPESRIKAGVDKRHSRNGHVGGRADISPHRWDRRLRQSVAAATVEEQSFRFDRTSY